MDEAASRLRMELDSMPVEVDQLERQIMQLEIEQAALKREKDEASRDRLKKLERELANLKERASKLKAQWQNEKAAINASSIINSQLEAVRQEQEKARSAKRRLESRRPDSIRWKNSRTAKQTGGRPESPARNAAGQPAA